MNKTFIILGRHTFIIMCDQVWLVALCMYDFKLIMDYWYDQVDWYDYV